MSRDYRKLRVFGLADALVPDIYQSTRDFPAEERFGLKAQIRRAAVSVPTNIVEGTARRSTKEYVNFLNVSNGSAFELTYLLGLSARLGMLDRSVAEALSVRTGEISASLTALIRALEDEP